MKNLFLTIFLFSTQTAFSQLNCHVKLSDSYSLKQIENLKSIEIKNADFSIDSMSNLILIHKVRGRRLEITLSNYELYSEKINLREFKNNTISRHLVPNRSVINSRFKELWNSERISTDTLFFDDKNEIRKHLSSYLNYLKILDDPCKKDCFTNTYNLHYRIIFSVINSVYEINTVENLRPDIDRCEELDKYMEKLTTVFPKIRVRGLDESVGDLSLVFSIVL